MLVMNLADQLRKFPNRDALSTATTKMAAFDLSFAAEMVL